MTTVDQDRTSAAHDFLGDWCADGFPAAFGRPLTFLLVGAAPSWASSPPPWARPMCWVSTSRKPPLSVSSAVPTVRPPFFWPPAGSASSGADSGGRIQLYVAGSDHSAADYSYADNQEGTGNRYASGYSGFTNSRDPFSHRNRDPGLSGDSVRGSADRDADVRQPSQGMRSYGTTEENGRWRADRYRHHLSGIAVGATMDACPFSESLDTLLSCFWARCLLFQYGRRFAFRQTHQSSFSGRRSIPVSGRPEYRPFRWRPGWCSSLFPTKPKAGSIP